MCSIGDVFQVLLILTNLSMDPCLSCISIHTVGQRLVIFNNNNQKFNLLN